MPNADLFSGTVRMGVSPGEASSPSAAPAFSAMARKIESLDYDIDASSLFESDYARQGAVERGSVFGRRRSDGKAFA